MNDKEYWLHDLKDGESVVYIGHIYAADKFYEMDHYILDRVRCLCYQSEDMKFRVLRDLKDKYICPDRGIYYGSDVFIIVKDGCLSIKDMENIEVMKVLFQ